MKMVANPKRDDRYEDMNSQDGVAYEHSEEDLHGIPMTEEAFELVLSVESPYRYEWIDGMIYNMSSPSLAHSIIASNLEALFRDRIDTNGPCIVFRDQSVLVPDRPSVTPDLVLTCDPAVWDKDKLLQPYKVQTPLIVIEILSPSTQRFDRTEKFDRYKRCPSLEVYILVNQYKRHVEVYQRVRDWQQELYMADQVVQFDQLDLELPLDAIYKRVL
jgi:Uma2 family endonuclease